MDNPREEKVAVVTEVRERFERSSAAILTEYRGLTVKDIAALRRLLTEAGGEYKVYKNTLVRFAVHDLGLEDLDGLLTGPTAIAFVDGDASSVAKALREYARTNPKLTVKGGVLGKKVMSLADAAALADLPPREVVLARLAGALAAPLQQFAGLLQAVPRSFAYGLKALIDKRGGVPSQEAAPTDSRDVTGTSAPVDEATSTSTDASPPAAASDAPHEADVTASVDEVVAEPALPETTSSESKPAESALSAVSETEAAASGSDHSSEPPLSETAPDGDPADALAADTGDTGLGDTGLGDPGLADTQPAEPAAAEGEPEIVAVESSPSGESQKTPPAQDTTPDRDTPPAS